MKERVGGIEIGED